MIKTALVSALAANAINFAIAECPNACNGHGKCTSYDMCDCNRNWQANDCSERVCQYGLAHVDTPKGDLNHDSTIEGPDIILVENAFKYPFGTTEKFPRMQDSDLATLDNTAHYYMECSNKGTCDRETGTCECFPGYDGAACQRASCPGYPESCSGHGVCKTIRQLAAADHGNVYELWDRDATMGCECDKGFTGPDCSLRECKYGIDPLYYDDTSTIKYAVFDFAILTTAADISFFTDGMDDPSTAKFALVFYDMHGESWRTKPISIGAQCGEVLQALKELPNDVIPEMDATFCTRTDNDAGQISSHSWDSYDNLIYDGARPIEYPLAVWLSDKVERSSHFNAHTNTFDSLALSGYIYRIHFNNNPGKLKQPEIDIYLDGIRPTVASDPDNTNEIVTRVWTDGQQGESVDYFGDHCDGVTVTLSYDSNNGAYLSGLTTTESNLLKACLSTSDFDDNNNVEVYDWDYGSEDYPHIVKLVLSVTDSSDGGYYAALYYDGTTFQLLNNVRPQDREDDDQFEVYTTKGVLARTSNKTEAAFGFGDKSVISVNATFDFDDSETPYDGDISCEVNDNNAYHLDYVEHCVNKSDIITFLNFGNRTYNPDYINLYTVERIYTSQYLDYDYTNIAEHSPHGIHYGSHRIDLDLGTNWAVKAARYHQDDGVMEGGVHIYKFFPNSESSYTYVAQCSNRGLCNEEEGLCECFKGYTGDACQTQASIAV